MTLRQRGVLAMIGAIELMAGLVLAMWAVVLILVALFTHLVLLVTRDRSVPWVRRQKKAPGYPSSQGL